MAFQDFMTGINLYGSGMPMSNIAYSDNLYSAINAVPTLSQAISNYNSANPYATSSNGYISPYGQNSLLKYLLMVEKLNNEQNVDSSAYGSDGYTYSTNITPRVQGDSLYNKHSASLKNASLSMTSSQAADKQNFESNFEQNKDKYEALAKKTHVPAKLIAAIHWRESGGNFNKKLRDGTSLGGQSFDVEAVSVLKEFSSVISKYGIDENTTDMAACAAFAEKWNGLGYSNKGKNSPYVYSGTSEYTAGKYVQDGVYDASVKDKQLGVVALLA